MKIAYVSDAIYPYNKGGKEKRLFELSTRLAKQGHDVHIYTMKWWEGSDIIQENGVTLHAICKLYPLYSSSGKRSIKEALAFSSYVLHALMKEDFDILDVDHMPYFPVFPAWLVAKLKGKKIIVTWHEYWGNYWFEYLGWKGIFGYCVEKFALLLGERIAVSELTKRRLKGHAKYIPNGINLEIIKKSKKLESYDVLFVGRLIKEKNVDLLIRSVGNKFSLGIIGTGPEEKKLKELAKNYPNINFLGILKSQEEVYGYMKGAKVFGFPSEREGFGIVVLEALACGLPVVVLDEKENASRFLVDRNSVCSKEAFAEMLGMKVKAKNIVSFDSSTYVWEKTITQMEEIYFA